MSSSITDSRIQSSLSFRRVRDGLLTLPGLPLADVLPAERIKQVFAAHDNLFATSEVYSTAMVLWAFLGQVLSDGKQASCESAVARIVVHQTMAGLPAPTANTGDYCRARAKLSEDALHQLTVEVAEGTERQATPWLWKGRHAKLVDGFTCTMPDTDANQREYPQKSSQKPGVGFPTFRAVVILSLATACAMELALGPYAGKKTGETALLRSVLESLVPGDVLVADRCYCSFMMIALLLARGCDVCTRRHQARHSDFRRGKRLGKGDHLIEWTRPSRPEWMDEATYASIPEKLVLREIRFQVVEPGRRTRKLTIITTLTDPEAYTIKDVAELYGYRWHAELDILEIKQWLHLDHLRCKSPGMVRREVWTTLLAYNLVRTAAASAALLHGVQPRQISFTATCQHVLSSWMILATTVDPRDARLSLCRVLLKHISQVLVGNRPGRIEPRVLKRRRHRYPLMTKPRDELRNELLERK